MANRSVTTGLQFLNAEKHLGERNKYVESEIALWIEAVLNDPIPPKDFEDLLRDGVLLCRVMNTLQPGSVAKIQKPWTKDNCQANIQSFLDAARSYGVTEDNLFTVDDLYNKTGVPNVIKAMIFLGKSIYDHPEWQGPYLGPKPTGHLIDWSEDKLRAGEGIVRLQAGTNKYATQKGLRIGTGRDIMFANICVEDKEGLAEWQGPAEEDGTANGEAVEE